MAGGAGAASAAGVIEMDVEVQRHIQNGFALAMVPIGQLSGFIFDGFVFRKKRDAWHNSIVTSAELCQRTAKKPSLPQGRRLRLGSAVEPGIHGTRCKRAADRDHEGDDEPRERAHTAGEAGNLCEVAAPKPASRYSRRA